jgi:hypothetical protein
VGAGSPAEAPRTAPREGGGSTRAEAEQVSRCAWRETRNSPNSRPQPWRCAYAISGLCAPRPWPWIRRSARSQPPGRTSKAKRALVAGLSDTSSLRAGRLVTASAAKQWSRRLRVWRLLLGDCASQRRELPPGFRRALSQKALVPNFGGRCRCRIRTLGASFPLIASTALSRFASPHAERERAGPFGSRQERAGSAPRWALSFKAALQRRGRGLSEGNQGTECDERPSRFRHPQVVIGSNQRGGSPGALSEACGLL